MWHHTPAAEAMHPEASGPKAVHLGHHPLKVCRQLLRFSGPHGAHGPGHITAVQAEVHSRVVRRMGPGLPVVL